MRSAKKLFLLTFTLLSLSALSQTLSINEFSNGPSGTQEYVELLVIDTSTNNSNCSSCIDIRGWIIDDNNGFHGAGGVASGCNRFSNDIFWSCIPLGTSITIYNGTDPNVDLPVNDLDINDGNCNLVMPIENNTFFESNPNTPGAIVCDYPNIDWAPGGIWSRMGMRNGGDCIRLVDLSGCEVFSLSYGDINLNSTIYFPGSGTDDVFYFSGTNPYNQADWLQGCAGDAGACLGNDQTPGAANSNLNSDYIALYSVNGCQPAIPITLILTNETNSCGDCTGSITLDAAQGQGPYNFSIDPVQAISPNPTISPVNLNNLCEGNYTATVIDENGCEDSQSFVIESDEPPTITTLNNLNTCNGSSVELSATIGGSASGISWVSPDGSFSDINSLITIFTPNVSDAIAFVVVTTQSANCGTIQENIFVNVSPPVDPMFSQVSDQCEGATFILNTTSENGVNGVWSPAINNTTSTNYTFTPDAFECANNGSMTITILPSTVSVLNQTVCESELPYTWNGVLFNAAGTQNTTLINTNGCDSLITMNLVVNQTLSSTENVSICSSLLPYTWNGILLNASGTQSMVFSSVESGCDSTASIILNVLPELSSNTIVTICETEVPFEWNGITVSSEGVLNVTLQSVISGCDSIATLDLTIINGSITFIDTSICEDELPYIWNGIELNDSGSETIVIEGSNGCDSMITINLLVHPIPEITLSTLDYVYCSSDTPEAIIFQNVFDEITWFSDENLTQIISNENEFIPLNIIGVTNYFVLATDEGCQSPSQIIVVEFKNCGLVIPTAITPDGDEKNDRWQLDDIDLLYPNNVVSIFNRWGNKIFESQKGLYNQMPWDGSFNNEVLPTASYYFIIEYNDGNTTASNGIVSIVK